MGHWGGEEVEEKERETEREGLDGYRERLVLTERERKRERETKSERETGEME